MSRQAVECQQPERSKDDSLDLNRLIRSENAGERNGQQRQDQECFLRKKELLQTESRLSKDLCQHKGDRNQEQYPAEFINLLDDKKNGAQQQDDNPLELVRHMDSLVHQCEERHGRHEHQQRLTDRDQHHGDQTTGIMI